MWVQVEHNEQTNVHLTGKTHWWIDEYANIYLKIIKIITWLKTTMDTWMNKESIWK